MPHFNLIQPISTTQLLSEITSAFDTFDSFNPHTLLSNIAHKVRRFPTGTTVYQLANGDRLIVAADGDEVRPVK